MATKSRKYSSSDQKFLSNEIQSLLQNGIIEASNSPWRAQVLVVNEPKSSMVVNYSQTVNHFTMLYAYPLPKIEEMVNKVAQYEVFSTLDMRSAHHQLEMNPFEKPYTAFEGSFAMSPFGLTNVVACFQRKMDEFVDNYKLKDTFVYVDNITIAGRTQEEHNNNLNAFILAGKEFGLTLYDEKCHYSLKSIDLLGYRISYGSIKPDPERLSPLLDIPIPSDQKTLHCIIGMFAYYAKWIFNFSQKIRPLNKVTNFPLNSEAVAAFKDLKNDLVEACLNSIDEKVMLLILLFLLHLVKMEDRQLSSPEPYNSLKKTVICRKRSPSYHGSC